MPERPIILTLQLDAASDAFLREQRGKHYPRDIDFVDAHLTLFHALPGGEFDQVLEVVAAACAVQTPFIVRVGGLIQLRRGVAYEIQSETLERFRAQLAAPFRRRLRGRDRERFRPHVTVQNKVSPQEAQALFDHLSASFSPFEAEAEGVQLWRYEGAAATEHRWTPAGAVAFAPLGR